MARRSGAQGQSAEDVSAWMRNNAPGVEVDPNIVRGRLEIARDHERLSRLNAASEGTTYNVEVERWVGPDGKVAYIVNDGSGQPVYVGGSYKEMVGTVKQRAGTKSINVIPRNFQPAKADALRSTFGLQRPPEVPLPRRSPTGARRSYSAPGPELVEGSATRPVLVRQGRFRGFYTASLRFISAGRQLTLRVYAKSRDALSSMVDTVAARLSSNPNRMSMKRLVDQARADLKSTYNITDPDLQIQIEDEFMNTFFVGTPRLPLNKAG